MLLAIDIGNSKIKYGFFEAGKLIDRFSVHTRRNYSAAELEFDRLKKIGDRFVQASVDTVAVASVVPELHQAIIESVRNLYRITPLFIDWDWDLGIGVRYQPRSAVGADRLVNAAAAAALYGKPVIICSFGTATTIDVVDRGGVFLGGAIAPGLGISAGALSEAASLLPTVELRLPPKAIGENTPDAMLSGIVLGHISMAEGMISRIKRELGSDAVVVATGGFGQLAAPNSGMIDILNETLTLEGLNLLVTRGRQPATN